jgi:Ca2+/Na+ antiporter
MLGSPIHEETLSSSRTTALFVILTLLFLALFVWRWIVSGFGLLALLFLMLFFIFLFYIFNYRVLQIRLTPETLTLRFGLFQWVLPIDNIQTCTLDRTSLWRIGGAGIHFSFFHGRYRAMFNFLEYPRLIIALKQKRGPVRDIAFSTRHPDQMIQLITTVITEQGYS